MRPDMCHTQFMLLDQDANPYLPSSLPPKWLVVLVVQAYNTPIWRPLTAGTRLSHSSFPRGFFCQSAIRVGFHNAVKIVKMLESHHFTGDITFVQITFSPLFAQGLNCFWGRRKFGVDWVVGWVFFSFYTHFIWYFKFEQTKWWMHWKL